MSQLAAGFHQRSKIALRPFQCRRDGSNFAPISSQCRRADCAVAELANQRASVAVR
jgi:hypothetical protein